VHQLAVLLITALAAATALLEASYQLLVLILRMGTRLYWHLALAVLCIIAAAHLGTVHQLAVLLITALAAATALLEASYQSVIDIESDFMVESSHDSAVSSSSPSSVSSYDGNSISNDSIQEQRRNDNHRYGISIERQMLLTNEDILLFGLTYSGFGEERQNVRNSLNVDRFKAHFGPEPRTVKDILLDLKAEFSGDVVYKDVMMAMNWLKLCKLSMQCSSCQYFSKRLA
jgi:hypothetical protein